MLGLRPPIRKSSFRGTVVVVGITGVLLMLSSGALGALAPGWSAGRTSQRGVVRVYIVSRHVVELIIELRTRCTDKKHREIWPGFESPFQHPNGPDRTISDSYDIVGRDAATGVRFRQQASFRARRSHGALIGSAMVTQTLIKTGVICRSPRVSFRVHLRRALIAGGTAADRAQYQRPSVDRCQGGLPRSMPTGLLSRSSEPRTVIQA